uniref:Uncharacterized protein n=1 Tax=Setaria italica TaxID=4555 RepID=K3YKL7_SETIT
MVTSDDPLLIKDPAYHLSCLIFLNVPEIWITHWWIACRIPMLRLLSVVSAGMTDDQINPAANGHSNQRAGGD